MAERTASVFVVTRVYLGADNVPRFDMVNGHGQAEFGVPVPVLGGANGRYIYVPPTSDGEELGKIIGINGATTLPGHGRPGAEVGAQFNPDFEMPPPTADYPPQHAVQDVVIASGMSRIVVAKDGAIVLDSPEASPVRVQLPDGGQLRVSLKGNAQGETLLLGNATLAVIQQLVDKVNELGNSLTSLQNAVTAGFLSVSYAPGVLKPLFQPTVTYVDMSEPDDGLVSAAFDISVLSKKDAAVGDLHEDV